MAAFMERRQFLTLALAVEGGLILFAIGLAWLLGVPLVEIVFWEPIAVLWGLGSAGLLLVIFGAAYVWPMGGYRKIKQFLIEGLGSSLAACRWYELFLVAALAGIGEELLFRGVLQGWMEQWGYIESLLISNILFAMCHAVTITYTLLAFGIGVFFGWLMDAPGERNLLAPILAHGLYDLVMFYFIARDWRKQDAQDITNPEPEMPGESPEPTL